MGAGITKLFKLGKGKEQRIVMLGLDAAGKTYASNVSVVRGGPIFLLSAYNIFVAQSFIR